MIVRVQNNDTACDEWAMLEFQGEILGILQGDLGHIEVTQAEAFMDIGQHTLEGEVVKLKSPFMVLEKEKDATTATTTATAATATATTTATATEVGEGAMAVSADSGNGNNDNDEDASLALRGFVHTKIIFKQRPRPKRLAR